MISLTAHRLNTKSPFFWLGCNNKFYHLSLTTVVEFKPLIDKLTGFTTKLRWLTSDKDTQGCIDVLSEKPKVRRLAALEDTPSAATCNNPLHNSISYTSLRAAWVEVFSLDLFAPALLQSLEFSLRGKISSAPWCKTLSVLSHSGFGQFKP